MWLDFGHEDIFPEENLFVVIMKSVLTIVFWDELKRIDDNETVPQVGVYFFVLESFLDLVQNFCPVDDVHLDQVFFNRTRLSAFLQQKGFGLEFSPVLQVAFDHRI